MDDKISRTLHVVDPRNSPLLTLQKGFAFARPMTTVTGPLGEPIGQINRDTVGRASKFTLRGPEGNPVGSITSIRNQSFAIADRYGTELAQIYKQSNGLVNDLLTQADRYVVQMIQNVQGPFRALIVATVFVLDVVLYENFNRSRSGWSGAGGGGGDGGV